MGSSGAASSAGATVRTRSVFLRGRSTDDPSSPPHGRCPTYFAVYADGELPVSFLGRIAAQIDAPVTAGQEHVVVAWPIGIDGRKRHAGAAVLSSEGTPLAIARALMIEPREATAG